MKVYDIQPVITEASLGLVSKNWYTFRVSLGKNKDQLKKEISQRFKVDVLQIRTLVMKGKQKRSAKTRQIVKKGDWKKAVVKIKEGQKIEAFDIGGAK